MSVVGRDLRAHKEFSLSALGRGKRGQGRQRFMGRMGKRREAAAPLPSLALYHLPGMMGSNICNWEGPGSFSPGSHGNQGERRKKTGSWVGLMSRRVKGQGDP